MARKLAVSLDVGGTNIKIAAVDSGGRIISRARRRMHQPSSKDALYGELAATISWFIRRDNLLREVAGVGIGFAGLTDGGRGRVYFAPNIGQLSNIEIKDELERRIDLRITVENDANCAVVGEYWQGAARGFDSVFMFTLGTGIGGGIILGGKLWRGAFGIAGEIGHTVVDPNGSRCACGNRGCLEALAGGTALVRDYIRRRNIRRAHSTITPKEVVERAKHGDRIAMSVVTQAGKALGIGIANVFNLVNPSLILIGGGVSRAGSFLLAPAIENARSLIAPALRSHLLVKRSRLGDDAGVLGSAYLCFKQVGVATS